MSAHAVRWRRNNLREGRILTIVACLATAAFTSGTRVVGAAT